MSLPCCSAGKLYWVQDRATLRTVVTRCSFENNYFPHFLQKDMKWSGKMWAPHSGCSCCGRISTVWTQGPLQQVLHEHGTDGANPKRLQFNCRVYILVSTWALFPAHGVRLYVCLASWSHFHTSTYLLAHCNPSNPGLKLTASRAGLTAPTSPPDLLRASPPTLRPPKCLPDPCLLLCRLSSGFFWDQRGRRLWGWILLHLFDPVNNSRRCLSTYLIVCRWAGEMLSPVTVPKNTHVAVY